MSKSTVNNSETVKEESLRWRFDVNTFRLLGRELITDRITAVFELVKNSYDANSTEVTVDLFNISNLEEGTITISDNGTGMSLSDIKDKWMVVGTNSKRTSAYSDSPFNRKFVGEKGIGRFAVDKLGGHLRIKTKKKGDKKWLNVVINWDEYEKMSVDSGSRQISLFTEIDNEYFFENGNAREQGTILFISKIAETWSDQDIDRLYRELSKIVSPFYPLNPPFDIILNSDTHLEYSNRLVKADVLKFYSHHGEITFDLEHQKQQILKLNEYTGQIYAKWEDIKSFGPVKMRLFYFNESAKRRYSAAYKNDFSRIDGIKIYRDGVIATPFAEYESDPNKKRDILGIDKRRWRGAFDKVSTREIIGIVDITKEYNPKIVDATNRQDFIDTPEYRNLKDFILEQIDVFGRLKDFERQAIRSLVEKKLLEAGEEVKTFSKDIKRIERRLVSENPRFVGILKPLEDQASVLHSTISQSISEQKKFQKDVLRKEKIYLSLMSLQDYAAHVSHAVRTSLGKIKRKAEFLNKRFPNPDLNDLFKKYAKSIYDEMNVLLRVTDFMLSYAGSDLNFEDFSIKDLIENLLLNEYAQTFKSENITVNVEIKDDFIINANKQFFHDILQNLVSNSIKALKNVSNKVIKCSGFLDYDNFTLYFSDNGYGVNKGDEEWIFGLYNTRTADQGGAGIGLYIVENRIKALKGSIELVPSEFKPKGATFKITLPFDKD